MKHRKLLITWTAWCALVVLVFFGIRVLIHSVENGRESKTHSFQVQPLRPYLDEDEALRIARLTLQAEGYNEVEWRPDGNSPTSSPDGKHDIFLFRSGIDPNQGNFQFGRERDRAVRVVELEQVSSNCITAFVRIPE